MTAKGIFDGLVIGVDQDEVLHKWNKTFHADARDFYPDIPFPFLTNNVAWDLTEGLDEDGKAAVKWLMNQPGFYQRLEPYEGAKEALEEMEAEGIEVFIVTSPTLANPTCASDKHASIIRDFGEKWAKRTVITDDKTIIGLDFLIDDKPEIKGYNTREGRVPTWLQILVDQPYNQHVETPFRLRNWSDWRSTLEAAVDSRWQLIDF